LKLHAHEGGHFSEGAFLKVWHLKNGQNVSGNFLYSTKSEIVLEQIDGNLVKIPIEKLAKNDLKFALFKIKKYTEIHQQYTQRNIINNQISFYETFDFRSFGYFLIFILILLLLRKYFSVIIYSFN
jgi:hypothetical protein